MNKFKSILRVLVIVGLPLFLIGGIFAALSAISVNTSLNNSNQAQDLAEPPLAYDRFVAPSGLLEVKPLIEGTVPNVTKSMDDVGVTIPGDEGVLGIDTSVAATACASNQIFCGGCVNGCRPNTKTCNNWIDSECNNNSTCAGNGTFAGGKACCAGTQLCGNGRCGTTCVAPQPTKPTPKPVNVNPVTPPTCGALNKQSVSGKCCGNLVNSGGKCVQRCASGYQLNTATGSCYKSTTPTARTTVRTTISVRSTPGSVTTSVSSAEKCSQLNAVRCSPTNKKQICNGSVWVTLPYSCKLAEQPRQTPPGTRTTTTVVRTTPPTSTSTSIPPRSTTTGVTTSPASSSGGSFKLCGTSETFCSCAGTGRSKANVCIKDETYTCTEYCLDGVVKNQNNQLDTCTNKLLPYNCRCNSGKRSCQSDAAACSTSCLSDKTALTTTSPVAPTTTTSPSRLACTVPGTGSIGINCTCPDSTNTFCASNAKSCVSFCSRATKTAETTNDQESPAVITTVTPAPQLVPDRSKSDSLASLCNSICMPGSIQKFGQTCAECKARNIPVCGGNVAIYVATEPSKCK